MAPGGGICQASTTTYRAILNAGLPVIQRRSHSLYVTYYKEYGVGIDATIFPGSQDLTFINDTGNYLLIQAYTDGNEAYVNIYGTPDGRKVAMDGPFFSTNAPSDLIINNRSIRGNEIAWKHYVLYSNGELKTDTIVSAYKSLPSYVKQSETAVINSFDILHAAAPNESLTGSENIAAEFID
jgi:vancomycin resistance protein YoaR